MKLSYNLWLHNKRWSKRLNIELLLVLILAYQKHCQSVHRPYLLVGPKANRKTTLLWIFVNNICHADNLQYPQGKLTEGGYEWRRQGRILWDGFAGCQVCLREAFQVLLMVNVDSHHPCSRLWFFNSYFGDSQPWVFVWHFKYLCVMVAPSTFSKWTGFSGMKHVQVNVLIDCNF